MPFLIFDLPALLSFRTFKEFITGTKLEHRSHLSSTMALITVLPLSIIFIILYPVFDKHQFDLANKVIVKEIKQKNTNFDISYFSESLDIGIKDTDSKSFIVFSSTVTDNLYKLKSKLAIWNKDILYIKKIDELPILEFLKEAKKLDLFFHEHFPILDRFINNYSIDVSLKKNIDKSLFYDEFIKLFQASCEISFPTLKDHINSFGPFLMGKINFCQLLNSKFGSKGASVYFTKSELYLVSNGNKHKYVAKVEPEENVLIYDINEKNLHKFNLIKLLDSVALNSSEEGYLPLPGDGVLGKKESFKSDQEKIKDLYNYFFDLVVKNYKQDFLDILKVEIHRSLKALQDFSEDYKYRNKLEEGPYDFQIQLLAEMYNAIVENNKKFFVKEEKNNE